MKFLSHTNNPPLCRESGMILLIALIMVLIMSLIGISAVKGTKLQEVMAGNMRDSQVSFQAAEAALRLAEERVNTLNPDALPAEAGIYAAPLANGSSHIYWRTLNWTDANSVKLNVDLKIQAANPRYVIEKLDVGKIIEDDSAEFTQEILQTVPIYRITARGVGLTDNTTTILQTVYRVY